MAGVQQNADALPIDLIKDKINIRFQTSFYYTMSCLSFKSLLLAVVVSVVTGTTAHAADVYPADLAKQEPKIGRAFSDLAGKLKKKHAWVRTFGVTTPTEEVTLGSTTYVRLSGCKPHDCPSEKYVVFISKSDNKAVGAFVVNRLDDGVDPTRSDIYWLGQPDTEQMAALASSLF